MAHFGGISAVTFKFYSMDKSVKVHQNPTKDDFWHLGEWSPSPLLNPPMWSGFDQTVQYFYRVTLYALCDFRNRNSVLNAILCDFTHVLVHFGS